MKDMKARWRVEADEWTTEGRKITSDENLEIIRKTLEEEGPVIVEHRFYRGSSSPDRLIFEDFEDLMAYLNTKVWGGDSIWIWSYAAVCGDNNAIAQGKCPDEDGCVPNKGAY